MKTLNMPRNRMQPLKSIFERIVAVWTGQTDNAQSILEVYIASSLCIMTRLHTFSVETFLCI